MLILRGDFFQAEDGIRDTSVTGVQPCALPICHSLTVREFRGAAGWQQAPEVGEPYSRGARFQRAFTIARGLRLVRYLLARRLFRSTALRQLFLRDGAARWTPGVI